MSDFIVGQSNNNSSSSQTNAFVCYRRANCLSQQSVPQPQIRQPINSDISKPQAEAKGKTVFEEVGDWLFKKFDELKKVVIKLFIAVVLACLLFGAIDVFFMQLSRSGKICIRSFILRM
jgi:hypothetical protein